MLEYIVTPLGGWQFKLEARLSADAVGPVRLAKRFVGGEQWWKVTDGHDGTAVQGHVVMMKQVPPDPLCPEDWLVVEPGATVELDPCCDLKDAYQEVVSLRRKNDPTVEPFTWTYEHTPNSLLEGAQEVAGSCTWSPETEERADGSAGGIHTMAVSEATAAGFND